ncbi:MAG TPA: TIGR00730 family Rossman fold protein [Flavobacteriales bacterium]|nr:TIGR00730 family Rossman fold protein [Flavobacteriales bacterium]
MKSIVVYCGSRKGNRPAYGEAARILGKTLADKNIRLVYGGGNVGLMGITADSTMQHGGEVLGIIPGFLNQLEVGHNGITELRVVENMHQRKLMMHEESDGIITLPGGFGTMEEIFEMLTWGQLGMHQKPIGVLNVEGYYDDLIAQADRMVTDDFLSTRNREMLIVESDPIRLIELLVNYVPSPNPIVITPERS